MCQSVTTPSVATTTRHSHAGPNDKDERFVIVLEIPPVKSLETAVTASILADSKQKLD
jgi:hypothetical protein